MAVKRTNILDLVLDEYVAWGGPVITRRVALQDCRDRGFSDKAIDVLVFGRTEVPAPENPEWHLDFFRRIQEMEAAREMAVAA